MPISKNRQTRLLRTQEKEAKKALFKYIFLTIVLVAIFAFVILPLVIPSVTKLLDETTGRTGSISSDDTTPPPTPRLFDVPNYSNSDRIEIKGSTEAGASVYVVVNDRDNKIIANASGDFSTQVQLNENDNIVYAFAEDESGNRSGESQKYTVIVDKEEPELEIIKPTDGAIFFGQEKNVSIEGQTEGNARVRINERIAIVNNEGKFNMNVSLNEGSNNFEIIANDEAGNETKITLTISYTP